MAQEKNMAERYSEAADIGTVKIADDVIALISAFAAMEVEGIASMAGGLHGICQQGRNEEARKDSQG